MDDSFIRSELRARNYNISKLARDMGVNYAGLRNRLWSDENRPVVTPTGPLPTDPTSVGKAGMAHNAVAVKPNGGSWPTFYFNAIQRARAAYDAGTHEMVQEKRPDGWIVLYSIPRLIPVKRKPYFSRRDV